MVDMFGSDYEVGDMVTIPKHRYDYLCEIKKKYFEVQKLVSEGEGIQVPEKSNKKIGRPKGTICNTCNVDYLSTHGLKRHINAFHFGQLNYMCKIRDKEFLTKEGIKMQMATHGKKDFKCSLLKPNNKECGATCSSLKSLKNHQKNLHGKQPKLKCKHCKVFSTNTKDNLKQHVVRCP